RLDHAILGRRHLTGAWAAERRILEPADIDKCSAAQAKIGRHRQRIAQFRGLRPDEPATQRIVGRLVMRTRATGLEATQVVATEEEAVDNFLATAGKQV